MTGWILLNIGVGVMWAIVGAIMSSVASSGRSITAFYAVGNGLTALVAWILFVDWQAINGDIPYLRALIFWMVVAGIVNGVGQILMISAMRRGLRNATWGIGQSAMLVSCLATVILFGEQPGAIGWTGILCLMMALYFLSSAPDPSADNRESSRTWLMLSLGTLLAMGAAQVLMGYPSRWDGFVDVARLRTPVTLTSAALFYTLVMLALRQRVSRMDLGLSFFWSLAALASYYALFLCLDKMAEHRLAGLVYPIGVGTCIVIFSLYSRVALSEPIGLRRGVGLGLTVTGITLLAFVAM